MVQLLLLSLMCLTVSWLRWLWWSLSSVWSGRAPFVLARPAGQSNTNASRLLTTCIHIHTYIVDLVRHIPNNSTLLHFFLPAFEIFHFSVLLLLLLRSHVVHFLFQLFVLTILLSIFLLSHCFKRSCCRFDRYSCDDHFYDCLNVSNSQLTSTFMPQLGHKWQPHLSGTRPWCPCWRVRMRFEFSNLFSERLRWLLVASVAPNAINWVILVFMLAKVCHMSWIQ